MLSLNLHRRHLSSSQRAVLALDIEKLLADEAKKRQVELAGTRPNSQVKSDTLLKNFTKVDESSQSKKSAQESEMADQTLECSRCHSQYKSSTGHICANDRKASAQAAAIVGTNAHYVADAKKIAQQSPELLADVRSGEKSITDAKRELKERDREQVREQNRALVANTPPMTQPVVVLCSKSTRLSETHRLRRAFYK